MWASPFTPIPGKVTNKTYRMQGWNAAAQSAAGGARTIDGSPYYATSIADREWRKGWREMAREYEPRGPEPDDQRY